MAGNTKKNENNLRVERRRFPRLITSADVEYTILEKKALQEKDTVSKNISAGGICLIAYEKVGLGSLLDLKIRLEDINETLEVKGRVVWSSYFTFDADKKDRYDLGIEFIEINESDRQKISKYILNITR